MNKERGMEMCPAMLVDAVSTIENPPFEVGGRGPWIK